MEQTEEMDSAPSSPVNSTSTPPPPLSSSHQSSGKGLDTVDGAQNDGQESVMLKSDPSAEYATQRTGNGWDMSLAVCPSQDLRVKEEEQEGSQLSLVEVKSEQELDAPLDFSLKRRDSVSETLKKDSRTSSSRAPHCLSFSSPSPRLSPDTSQQQKPGVPRNVHRDSGSSHDEQEQGFHAEHSPNADYDPSPGLPKVAGKAASGNGRGAVAAANSSLAALGIVSEESEAVVTPATLDAVLGQNGSMMGMSSIPTLLGEARKLQANNGGKVVRPFKAYPKEVLNMPLGYFGLPGVSPFPSMDSNFLSGLSVLPDDIMTTYKQQAELLKEREKPVKNTGKRSTSRSPPLSALSPLSASTATNNSSHTKNTPLPSSASFRHPPPHLPSLSSVPTASRSPDLSAEPHTTSLPHAHSPSSLAVNQGADSNPSTSSGPPMVSSTSSVATAGGSRKRPRNFPDSEKDDAYWERRRKNNDAAKRSRDARRAKEDEIAIRAALLEQENLKLRVEVATLKTETARLRCLLYKT